VIERRLHKAAKAYFPATPTLAGTVRGRLPARPDDVARSSPRRLIALAIAVALALVGAGLAATSLGLVPGVRVRRAELPPAVPFTQFPGYGRGVTLSEAQAAAPFRLLLPQGFGAPDRVLLDRDRAGAAVVTTVYGDSRRAQLVLTQWVAGALLFDKMLSYETHSEYVDVAGAAGLWIEGGRFHDVFYLSRSANEQRAPGFLGGNVLVWQRGSVSYRLEAAVRMGRALELARRLRPA
jgi:hypothetical protein